MILMCPHHTLLSETVTFVWCSVGKFLYEFSVSVCSTAEAECCCLFSGAQQDSEDQAKVIVGVVVGILLAAALVGLIYWLYIKNSRYRNTFLSVHLHFIIQF